MLVGLRENGGSDDASAVVQIQSIFAFWGYRDEEACIKAGVLETLMKNRGEQCSKTFKLWRGERLTG